MTTRNLISVEGKGFEAEKTHKARKAYQTPDVLAVGPAVKLVQGPMISATYRDLTNSGWTYFDVM